VTRDGLLLYYEFTLDRPYEIRAREYGYGGTVVNDITPGQRTADGVWLLQIGHWEADRLAQPYDTLSGQVLATGAPDGRARAVAALCGQPQQVDDGPRHWQWTNIGIPRERSSVPA
jgi:hypothetical protein